MNIQSVRQPESTLDCTNGAQKLVLCQQDPSLVTKHQVCIPEELFKQLVRITFLSRGLKKHHNWTVQFSVQLFLERGFFSIPWLSHTVSYHIPKNDRCSEYHSTSFFLLQWNPALRSAAIVELSTWSQWKHPLALLPPAQRRRRSELAASNESQKAPLWSIQTSCPDGIAAKASCTPHA